MEFLFIEHFRHAPDGFDTNPFITESEAQEIIEAGNGKRLSAKKLCLQYNNFMPALGALLIIKK